VAVERLVGALGGRRIRMDAERHDRLVAVTSHVPQLASGALMGQVGELAAGDPDLLLLAAGGFRDLTRLAASNPGRGRGEHRGSEIVHSAEGARGALHLTVAEADARAAGDILCEAGYDVARLA